MPKTIIMSKGITLLALLILSIIIASTDAKAVGRIPRSRLKKRHVTSAPPKKASPTSQQHFQNSSPAPPAAAAVYDWVQREFVTAHNALRATVGSPPLEWDATLANFSRGWAHERKKDCSYRSHSPGGKYGENLFWQLYKESSPTQVVRSWFEEQKWYDHERHRCTCEPERDGCECGHYTNIVWRSTKKVGCSGFVYCNDQRGVYVVCSYYPKGNIVGKNPFDPR
ncbi:unnamed protein product [Cuscuta europaea]|uniref:SCP domain-containing protein n=1 Tax=Cuscuta europaea TaxID=41803 RepID=A0A9P1EAK0_CUSEU|nr:unnamed protein product [Cuscuta europaea]